MASRDRTSNPFTDSGTASEKSSFRMESRPCSDLSLNGGSDVYSRRKKAEFRSYRLIGKYEQPWLDDPRMFKTKHNSWVVYVGIVVGVALSALLCFRKYQTVVTHDYCLIMDEHFERIDPDVWTHEVQIDGYGTGSFDWTTTDPKNSYVDSEGLHIVPTLTNETTDINNDKIYNGYALNLTKDGGDGTCTGKQVSNCAIASNSTLGRLLPPVRSARMTTVGKKTIKYGRVEVTAKLPRGDWLWPAIWMMPNTDTYGEWPRSGEIDIVEARGNGYDYILNGLLAGRDVVTSTLHWGPSSLSDAYWRTTNGRAIRRTDYTEKFHTYGLEWSEDYIYTYIDSRLVQVLYFSFDVNKETMWQRGNFSTQTENSTFYDNPWINSTTTAAPFDQEFYLILNVAVGSRNGWFKDGIGKKPWLDAATNAAWTFYDAADEWLPTWGKGADRGMTVKSVKMWQQGKCGATSK